jgi:cytidine deaminase
LSLKANPNLESKPELNLEFNKDKLAKVLTHSYSPFSKFKVAACVQSASGAHYYGCNVENSTFGATICAERTAIVKMISEEGPLAKITKVYVLTKTDEPVTPCGICRQNIYEFLDDTKKDIDVTSFSKDFKIEKTFSLLKLFPEGFKL